MFIPPTADSREEGNTFILSVALAAVAIAIVLTLATITQIHIDRKRLHALVDAAALHAASALDEHAYFTSPGADVELTNRSVRAATTDFLDRLPRAQRERFHGLHFVTPTTAVSPDTAQVTLSSFVRPGYIPWAVTPFDGFRLEATATARAE